MLDTRESIKFDLMDMTRALAAFDVQVKVIRLAHVLRKYSPDQPRMPAGLPEGGQWTSGGGGGGDQSDESETASTEEGRSASDGGEKLPEIPKEKPATAKERTRIIKLLARRNLPAMALELILQAVPWLIPDAPVIKSYGQYPKTLEELQRDVDDPAPGYDIHHIVEQTSAEQDGFSRSQIDAPENLVRIPRVKHQDITAWYNTINAGFGDMSPRDYLRGRSWEERYRVGLDALRDAGILNR